MTDTTVSANDALVDLYLEHAIDLLRLEAGTRDKVISLFDALEKEIVGQMAEIDPTGTPKNALRQRRLAELLKVVQDSIRGTYRTADTLLANEIRDVIDTEAAWTGRAMNSAMKVDFADVGLTRQFVDTLASDVLIQGAPTADWWGRQAQGLSDKF